MKRFRPIVVAFGLLIACSALAAGQDHADGHGDAHGDDHGAVYSVDGNQSGTPDWRDPSAGDHYVVDDILFHAINFGLLAGLLWWFGVPVVRDGLRSRAVTVREDIESAQSLREEAERRHASLTGRLAAIEEELSAMQDRAVQDATVEAEKIEARARAAAAALEETVGRQIQDEGARARQALRQEAAELAVTLAEGILRDEIGAEDHKRLAASFLSTVRHAEESSHAQ